MNKLLLTLLSASALVATLSAAPAMSATLTASNLNGNSFIDYSADGLVSFDFDALNTQTAFFDMSFSAAEISAGSVSLNAVVNNFLAGGIAALQLNFGTTPIIAGTVQSAFNSGATGAFTVTQSPAGNFSASNPAAPFEYFGMLVGSPFASGSNVDWQINTAGLSTANSYSFSLQAVPEPGTWAMLFSGLAVVGAMARRRTVK